MSEFRISGGVFCATGWQVKKILDGSGAERIKVVYYPNGREVVHYKMEEWMIPLIEAALDKKVIWNH